MTISLDKPISVRESFAYCRSLSRRAARNFYFAFLTLPGDRFRDMCALYAFMRVTDDLGDDASLPVEQRTQELERWRASLRRALDETGFDHHVLPALADVVHRYRIPEEHLLATIEGVRADLEPAGFETFDELERYCYQVAGAVGLCCIHVWGFHDERAIDAAVDCGLAFQLTNILRDLGEDAHMGRVYLPRTDLRRFGYTAEDISGHRLGERFEQLMRFEVERARSYYARAEALFDYLEPCGKPIYAAMLRIYGGLLNKIERRGFDVYSRRIALPSWRKGLIALDAIVRHRWLAR